VPEGQEDPAIILTGAQSVVGHTYQLQSRSDLLTGTWTNFGEPIAGDGTVLKFSVSLNVSQSSAFYRILITR
jgi:hypothetical protein